MVDLSGTGSGESLGSPPPIDVANQGDRSPAQDNSVVQPSLPPSSEDVIPDFDSDDDEDDDRSDCMGPETSTVRRSVDPVQPRK